MKQVLIRNGAIVVANVPAPSPEPGRVLIATAASVISSGTERAAFGSGDGDGEVLGGSRAMRAIRHPGLVLKTIQHAREHGVRQTRDLMLGRGADELVLDDLALGYSCAGTIVDTGGIADFRVGQAVACAGAGKANHAEVVAVPGNLVAAVPDGVSLRDAAFTTLGAIAMQGVRRAEPTLGERVVVIGLGLLGLLTIQILRAAGCQVVGVEPIAERRDLALALGAETVHEPADAPAFVKDWSGGVGADVAIVTASTASDAVLNGAIAMVRRKGRVVPVGDVGMAIERAPLYAREADVLISTSYGPGRYDPLYEEGGLDYPISYVRWTENRNMEEFLRLLATGQVNVEPLIGVELPVDGAPLAYEAIRSESPPLAAVLTYDGTRSTAAETVRIPSSRTAPVEGSVGIAVIGPGAFVRAIHLSTIAEHPHAEVTFVVSRTGKTATDVARALRGADTATDWRTALQSDAVDLVLIGTRHNSHAEIAAAALRAGKAVFVEKPLGITQAQIDDVWEAAATNDRLAIGFNRPFALLSRKLHDELTTVSGPIQLVYRVNAPLPHNHWLNDPEVGGGRVLGEACHMLDYANWLCGTPTRVFAAATPAPPDVASPESVSITVEYSGGSIATVHYTGLGASSMPKERIEAFRGGRSWVLDDFVRLRSFASTGDETVEEGGATNKGHAELLKGVIAACRGEQAFAPGIHAAYSAQAVALAALASISSAATAAVPTPGHSST